MGYSRINVVRPTGVSSPGAPAPKDPNVVIVAVEDIATWPLRDGNGVNIQGSFTMKPSAKMIEFYMTPTTIKAIVESTGDEDAIAFMHKFEGEAPGHELVLAEAVQNWKGVPCIIIYGSCSEAFRKVLGTKCAPMQMKAALQDDKDARKWKLNFESFVSTGYLPGHYTGSIVTADPFVVVDNTAVAIAEANGRLYQLQSSAAGVDIEIATTDLVHDDIVTLIGGGGASPDIVTSNVANKGIVLKDGTTWTALNGAVLHLKVFDAGVNQYFMEIGRG